MLIVSAVLGIASFIVMLGYHAISDGDLWARLSIGGEIVRRGHFFYHDPFAFTPTLPEWIDHEWGAGLIFFIVLQAFGPAGLMWLKIISALACVGMLLWTARKSGANWPAILLLALPCGFSIMAGYVPVIRSQAFTYCFFALLLLVLEQCRQGHRRWAIFLPVLFLVWANVHGGFVAGLGVLTLYTGVALLGKESSRWWLLGTLAASFAITLVNPYGLNFWRYLIPALLHPRAEITEWQPMQVFSLAIDHYVGFRITLLLMVASIVLGWRRVVVKNIAGLATVAVTCFLAVRSRRHEPFFAEACLAFAAPYLEAAVQGFSSANKSTLFSPKAAVSSVLALYVIIAGWVTTAYLPRASFQVLSPVGFYPVRELDILNRAGVTGNVAVPFRWGSYVAWRSYPRLKVSIDGRYETVYPESTFEMNQDFYHKRGANWDRLLREFQVDYIILEGPSTSLRPEDLTQRGYMQIWESQGYSALFARQSLAMRLLQTAQDLPPETVEPLDATIPDYWPSPVSSGTSAVAQGGH